MTFEAAQIEVAAASLSAAQYAAAAARAEARYAAATTLAEMRMASNDARYFRATAKRYAARANAIVDSVECAA